MADGTNLLEIFDLLLARFGPQHWWPGDTPTEVVIGAILTQNTAWRNVEHAITNLKRADCLNFSALAEVTENRLAELIQPSGTFRVKARRLKSFVERLYSHHDGSLDSLLGGDLSSARRELLSISGIGPETADAILLYAGNRPAFVVDAYTKRVLRRHFVIEPGADYDTVRDLFLGSLPTDVEMFNEYHALLVEVGKQHCRVRATCDGCPLDGLHHDATL